MIAGILKKPGIITTRDQTQPSIAGKAQEYDSKMNQDEISKENNPSKTSEEILNARDMAVGYHGRVLIGGISFLVKKGTILTLIGPNGAGKSTILKSLTRQLTLISGDAVVCGKSLGTLNASSLAKEMSVLLTERIKEGYLTAFDVAAMGRYPFTGRMGLLDDEDRRVVREALEAVEAYELSDRRFSELSDGQKQRVLLARSLAQEPKILVLDEPTAYLDIRYQMKLMDLLRDLAGQRQMTIVLSLHEVEQAARISDQVLMVKSDRTCEIRTPDELLEGREIEKLFGLEEGRFDPLLGSSELKRPKGRPEVFVISSGGTGIPLYRKLVRKGIPFAAGILYENDLDARYAALMASEVILEKPFVPISDETLRHAKKVMNRCEKVLNAGVEIGTINTRIRDLIKKAEREGKLSRL